MTGFKRILALVAVLMLIFSGSIFNISFQDVESSTRNQKSEAALNSLPNYSKSSLPSNNSALSNQDPIPSFRASAKISDFGQRVAKETLQRAFQETITEGDVVDQIDFHMIDAGSDETLAFSTIIASGEDSVLPHGDLANDKHNYVVVGEAVVCDLGAKYAGYSTDITRTYFIGPPTPEMVKIYQIVLEAQQAGIHAVGPGVNVSIVAHAVRDIIDAYGYGKYFPHLTGHSLGTHVHEQPLIGVNSPDVLKSGMVITVEPGIYLPEAGFGVRVEDDVLVTDSGYEVLTHTPKALSDVVLLENSSLGFPSVKITHPLDGSMHYFGETSEVRAKIVPNSAAYPVDRVQCKIGETWRDMTPLEGSRDEYEYSFHYSTSISGHLKIGVRATVGELWRTDLIEIGADLRDTPTRTYKLPDTYQSAHPYERGTNTTWIIQHNGTSQLRVRFAALQVAFFSHLYLRDTSGHIYIDYEGVDELNADIWSPWIPKDAIVLHLDAEFGEAYGFHVDCYEIPVPNRFIPVYSCISTIFSFLVILYVIKQRKTR
ncbi:MAG: M24 family metallopeptidase [Candidatus Heimdallarchaeota archaeon]